MNPTARDQPAHEFTVFTPTYNRAHTLHRVYDSLKDQTFRDFEWLIVDDGSTDNTRDLVAEWRKQAWFPIRYEYQENKGKPAAFNHGVDLACGELFLSVDSDDAPMPHALQTLHDIWHGIPVKERARFTGVTGLCIDEHGNRVSRPFKQDVLDCSTLESRFVHKARGDKWGFNRTSLLRQFPFPSIPGCKFIPESYVWDSIARAGYKTRYVTKILHVVYVPAAGGDNLSTNSSLGLRNSEAYVLWTKNALEHDLKFAYLWRSPLPFLKMATRFVRYGFHTSVPVLTRVHALANGRAKLAAFIGLLPGWLLFMRDRYRQARAAKA